MRRLRIRALSAATRSCKLAACAVADDVNFTSIVNFTFSRRTAPALASQQALVTRAIATRTIHRWPQLTLRSRARRWRWPKCDTCDNVTTLLLIMWVHRQSISLTTNSVTCAVVDAQNALTTTVLAQCDTRNKFAALMRQLYDYPKYGTPSRHGDRWERSRQKVCAVRPIGRSNLYTIYGRLKAADRGAGKPGHPHIHFESSCLVTLSDCAISRHYYSDNKELQTQTMVYSWTSLASPIFNSRCIVIYMSLVALLSQVLLFLQHGAAGAERGVLAGQPGGRGHRAHRSQQAVRRRHGAHPYINLQTR